MALSLSTVIGAVFALFRVIIPTPIDTRRVATVTPENRRVDNRGEALCRRPRREQGSVSRSELKSSNAIHHKASRQRLGDLMALEWPFKDPDEVLDYQLDWSGRLGEDQISTSTWTVPTGIVKNSDTNTATVSTVWLSSGTLGTSYDLVNRVITTGGRTMDQTVRIRIKAK
jgi:hypothetical protein